MSIIPIMLLLIIVLITFSALAGLIHGHSQWSKAFESIADRYGGMFSSARTSRPPIATFNYRGQDVRVRCKRIRRVNCTELRMRWPKPGVRLEVVPQGSPALSRKLRSVESKSLNDPEFDGQFDVYWLTREDENYFSKLFSEGVQWQIRQLKQFFHEVPLYVTIEREWLTIRKSVYLKTEEQLNDFVRLCLELHDQMLLTESAGIQFHENNVIGSMDDASCPICSSEIEGQMVLCIRCKTPHCHDCWEYNQKCGMYACDEARFVRVG